MQREHRLDQISFGKIVQIRENLIRAQEQGKKVYRFESGDPNFDLSPETRNALVAALDAGKTHYVPNAGIDALKKQIVEKLRFKNKIEATPDQIFVTNGAMNGLYVLFQCLVGEGDEVILPDPMWTEIAENVKLAGGVPVKVGMFKDNGAFGYNAEEIAKAITPRTVAIFVNSPQNPTGVKLKDSELKAIVALAKERGLWLVADEAYEDIQFTPAEYFIGSDPYEKIVSLFSMSKSHNMSGLRVGYMVVRDRFTQDRVAKLLRCVINGVNSLAQWAAVEALKNDHKELQPRMLEEYRHRRELFYNTLKSIDGFHPYLPDGSFFIWARVDRALLDRLGLASVDDLSDHLAALGIGSTPGSAFSDVYLDCIRFSFSCDTQMVEEGLKYMAEVLQPATVLA